MLLEYDSKCVMRYINITLEILILLIIVQSLS